MDAEAVGTYVLLLCEQWQQGAVEVGAEDELATMYRTRPEVVRGVLETCFEQGSTGWRNMKLESLRKEKKAKSASRRRAAKARWDKGSDASASVLHEHNDAIPEPEPDADAETTTTAAGPPEDGSATLSERPAFTRAELWDLADRLLGLDKLPNADHTTNGRILNAWLYSSNPRSPTDVALAIEGAAELRDRDAIGWDSARPGTPMTLKALNGPMTLADQGDGKAVRDLFSYAVDYMRSKPDPHHATTPTAKRGHLQRIDVQLGGAA